MIKKKQLYLNEKPIHLLSGEIHYWRVPSYYWKHCLQRIKEMGITIIATYICWEFHEYEEGKLDFTGTTAPERDLVGFLELCREMEFRVIIRPGPYIYSEWQQAGIPARLAKFHRLHPAFLNEAKKYIQQVTDVLKPFFHTNGGNIILLQADNEIDSFAIFHARQLEIYGGEGLFQEFLTEKYESIDQLNESWQSCLTQFSDAIATITVKDINPWTKIRALDFRAFHHWCAQKIARWMIETYTTAGVDIPIHLNTVHNCYSQNLREMANEFGLIGIDLYPSNEFHSNDYEHLTFLRNVCYASAVTSLPYIPEFQCGIWHGFHYLTGNLTANHYRMSCLTALMGGIVGWNWYMLVERDNWYYSPINSRGYKRPELFEPLQKIVKVFQEIEPAELTKLTATAITEDENHFLTESMGHKNLVAQAVYQSGIAFKSYDLLKPSTDCQLLFYAGPEWMDAERQKNLHQFVAAGGVLVCFNSVPYLNEKFKPYSELPFIHPDGTTLTRNFDLHLGTEILRIKDSLSIFRQVDGEPIFAAQSEKQVDDIFAEENDLLENQEAGTKFIIGYQKQIGDGKIIFLGCAPNPEIIFAIHSTNKAPIYCHTNLKNVQTALFQKTDSLFYLIVINAGLDSRDIRIWLLPALFGNKKFHATDLFTSNSEVYDFKNQPAIMANVNKKDGTIIRLNQLDF
ncbi:MAG TPA: beta-galactosidase [bacterium]